MLKHINGWIIEGVVASGKTTFIRELQYVLATKHPSRTKIYISEHYTERVLEDKKAKFSLKVRDTISLALGFVEELEGIASWKSESKFNQNQGNAIIDSTLERFLGSHYANLKALDLWHSTSDEDSEIIDIYKRLQALGFSVVILKLPDSLIAQAIVNTKRYRNANWHKYLETIGNEQQVISYYLNWQNNLFEFYNRLYNFIEVKTIVVDPINHREHYEQEAIRLVK